MGQGAGADADLIGEESFTEANQELVEGEEESAATIETEGERIRRWDAPCFQDFVAGLLEQGAQGAKSKEAPMS